MLSIVVISKDEPALEQTLADLPAQLTAAGEAGEVIVVDASSGRLEAVRERSPATRWIDFIAPAGARVSIPHQRNAGFRVATGEIMVFIDAGCRPQPGWLSALVTPLLAGDERVTAGLAIAPQDTHTHYQLEVDRVRSTTYLDEAPTLNLAFHRDAFDAVGGFDERFEYGSDIDFSWRLIDNGFLIRSVPDAMVEHDWGSPRRQLRRAYVYGAARARLYLKHSSRRRQLFTRDPVLLAYPLFLLGLPLVTIWPLYPALLILPAYRARGEGGIGHVLADHLVYGAGALSVLGRHLISSPGRRETTSAAR